MTQTPLTPYVPTCGSYSTKQNIQKSVSLSSREVPGGRYSFQTPSPCTMPMDQVHGLLK